MANTSANVVSRSDRVRATCLLLVAACLWGSSFVGSKICLNAGMYPFETIFYRMAAGSLVMGIVFWKQLRTMTRQALKAGILLGLVTFSGYCFEMYGISMTAASKSSFITATNIVMLPFLYALFFHTRISIRSVGAALVALAGIWFLSQTGSAAGGVAVGDILLLITAFLYAMNSITVAKLGSTESPIQVTFLQLLTTMVGSGIGTLFQGRCGNYPPQAIGAVVYLTIGPTLICFLIKNYAIQRISPVRCALILSTEGIFCALLSILLLHERLTPSMCFGIVLILCGILTEQLGHTVWERLKLRLRKEHQSS